MSLTVGKILAGIEVIFVIWAGCDRLSMIHHSPLCHVHRLRRLRGYFVRGFSSRPVISFTWSSADHYEQRSCVPRKNASQRREGGLETRNFARKNSGFMLSLPPFSFALICWYVWKARCNQKCFGKLSISHLGYTFHGGVNYWVYN